MTKIIRYDKRTLGRGTPREIVLLIFDAEDVPKETGNIPVNLIEHWEKDKSLFGYASFEGLSKKDCKKIYGFAKVGKVRLGVSRMGNIVSFKIEKERKMKDVLIPRWYYDNVWNAPLFDVDVVKKGTKYKDKFVHIQIDVIRETDKALYCYVNLVKDDGTIVEFYSAYGTWVPKSVIKED